MSDLIKIAVDAMGGDNSPKKIIDGIILNHKSNKNNFFNIFGDRNKIYPLINGKISEAFFDIIHTENKIESKIKFVKDYISKIILLFLLLSRLEIIHSQAINLFI